MAAKTYCTPTFKDADIVVANAYPQNAQAFHGGLWINYSVREGGTGVLIVQHPLGLDPVHYLNNRLAGTHGATQFDLTARRVDPPGSGSRGAEAGNMIVYSQYLTQNMRNYYRTGTFFYDKWDGRDRQAAGIASRRPEGRGLPVRRNAAPGDRARRVVASRVRSPAERWCERRGGVLRLGPVCGSTKRSGAYVCVFS